MVMKPVGVLALQGAFREHKQKLEELGASVREIRQKKDIANISGLVIPGGESTTMGKLLVELDILLPLKNMLENGLPVFGTCAGLILLCKDIQNSDQPRFGILDAVVKRNAFGRQAESFETLLPVFGEKSFPAVFIRAPVIESVGSDVEVLASIMQQGQTKPVAIRQKNVLATAFHPELTKNSKAHAYFLSMTGE